MRARRATDIAIAGMVGALLGALVVLSVDAATREATTSPPSTHRSGVEADVTIVDQIPADGRSLVLAWAPGGLPRGAEARAEAIPGVRRATSVHAGLLWLDPAEATGRTNDSLPAGFSIPIEVALVDPTEYVAFVPPSERDAINTLATGTTVLSQTSAQLRRAQIGSRLGLDVGTTTVSGLISDASANGYEMLLAEPAPEDWPGVRYLLIEAEAGVSHRIESRLSRFLGPEYRLRVRTRGETPFLRYGDAVQPQMILKRSFGEFGIRQRGDGSFDIDPRWRADNIRTARVPILGEITCHRAIFSQLRSALEAVRDHGLGSSIDRGDYGGCFSPRFINADPRRSLSHHAWGVAIDFNVSANDYGAEPTMDRRIVELLRSWGFTWGGEWLIPDGMHFEWVRFPS